MNGFVKRITLLILLSAIVNSSYVQATNSKMTPEGKMLIAGLVSVAGMGCGSYCWTTSPYVRLQDVSKIILHAKRCRIWNEAYCSEDNIVNDLRLLYAAWETPLMVAKGELMSLKNRLIDASDILNTILKSKAKKLYPRCENLIYEIKTLVQKIDNYVLVVLSSKEYKKELKIVKMLLG